MIKNCFDSLKISSNRILATDIDLSPMSYIVVELRLIIKELAV